MNYDSNSNDESFVEDHETVITRHRTSRNKRFYNKKKSSVSKFKLKDSPSSQSSINSSKNCYHFVNDNNGECTDVEDHGNIHNNVYPIPFKNKDADNLTI